MNEKNGDMEETVTFLECKIKNEVIKREGKAEEEINKKTIETKK